MFSGIDFLTVDRFVWSGITGIGTDEKVVAAPQWDDLHAFNQPGSEVFL